MVDQMLHPKRAPDGNSYTLGWDVVCSYSEEHINKLLAVRHAKTPGNMLKDVELACSDIDPYTEEEIKVTYKLAFGPPLLQFNARAQSGPACSLKMKILKGTVQFEGREAKPIKEGYTLKLNGIPLGSAQGNLVGGTVEGKPDIIPGSKAVFFDSSVNEERHVVLDFPILSDSLVVTCEADDPSAAAKSPLTGDLFQKRFKMFFLDPEKCRALSYSIASVNNTSPKYGSHDLEPVSFQFATFRKGEPGADGAQTSLSVFIGVEGGDKRGVYDGLQPRWQSQWIENNNSPIPYGFTASLILSANLVFRVLLVKGFKEANWIVEDNGDANGNGFSLKARNQGTFSASRQAIKHGKTSTFYISGFTAELKDSPMYLQLTQPNGSSQPKVEARWQIEKTVKWQDQGKFLGLLDTEWGDNTVKLVYKLCDANDHSRKRVLPCNCTMNDEAFDLNIQLKGDHFWRMDQEDKGDDWYEETVNQDTWDGAMSTLSGLNPNSEIKSIGLGFLRTTNLLMPGEEVIDFNEAIGVKIPHDLVLVGDVLPK